MYEFYKSLTNGSIYYVLDDNVMCATNEFLGARLVVYVNVLDMISIGNNKHFAKSYDEFMKEFKLMEK